MSELRECPKCGQEVKGYVTGGDAAFGCGEYGFDVDCPCGISYSTGCYFETPEDAEEVGAIEWNARDERTCELVRCGSCVNWGAMRDLRPPDWCPVVRKCTYPSDWCCWAARAGEADGARVVES